MTAHVQAADKIVNDAEYYILKAQNGKKWAKEDKELDKMIEIRVYEANAQSIRILNEAIKTLQDLKLQAEDINKIKLELEKKQNEIIKKLTEKEKEQGNNQ